MAGPHYTSKGDRYLVRLPGTDKARGYTRATTFIKGLDDVEGIIPWAVACGIIGVHRDPGIAAEWAALIAEHPDPWYVDKDTKKRTTKLVEDAKNAGGAKDRARIGTALHDMIRVLNRGGTLGAMRGMYGPDIDAYERAMAEHGIVAAPEWCEVTLYNDVYNIVGQVDGLAWHEGQLTIFDLKTGGTGELDDNGKVNGVHQQAWGAQTAIYQMARHQVIWPEDKEAECTLVPMPETRSDYSIIVHLPAGSGKCSLYKVDLKEGREDLELAARWRERHNHGQRKNTICTPLTISDATCRAPVTPVPVEQERATATSPAPGRAVEWDEAAALREWLVGRVRYGAEQAGTRYLDLLASMWPVGVLTFGATDRHELAELELIEKAIVWADAELGIGWPVERPTAPVEVDPFDFDQRPAVPAQPNPPTSLPASKEWCDQTADQLRKLPPDLLAWVEQRCANVPNLASGKVTVDDARHVRRVLRWTEYLWTLRVGTCLSAGKAAKFTTDDIESLALLASGGKRPLSALTEADTWRLRSLFDAVEDGWPCHWDENGYMVALGVPDETAKRVSTRWQGARPAIAAAKAHALELERPVPRTLTEALADPAIAAALTFGAAA